MSLEKRGKEENFYVELQDITLKRLEDLCGEKWTDYNVHDPGITIADYFNYGIFELHYRLQFPFENYLIEPGEKTPVFSRKGLLPKEELFSQSVVTPQDYQELIKSQSKNIKSCTVRFNIKSKLYDVFIIGESDVEEEDKLIEIVKRTYHSHRNLCENLGQISIKKPNSALIDSSLNEMTGSIPNAVYEKPEFATDKLMNDQTFRAFSEEYYSIQLDFPETYGISERGIPKNKTKQDQAKILQLKAYLLIFDYLLADTLKQAGKLKELFEFSGHVPASTMPEVSIPEWENIIDSELKKDTALRDAHYYKTQKALYFDLLDKLYGEDTRHIGMHDFSSNRMETEHNEQRANLIRKLPALNANRFIAFNIYDETSTSNIQQMMEALSNFKHHTKTIDTFGKYGLRIISDDEFYEKYKFLQHTTFHLNIEESAKLEDIPVIQVIYEDRAFHKLRMNINLLWYNVLFKSFLLYGDDKRHYRILILPDNEYLLVFKHPEMKDWINMGVFFAAKEKLIETANLFWQFIRNIKHQKTNSSFYFIEHILLENNDENDHNELSVIIAEDQKSDLDKEQISEILDERLPAHLSITMLYLSPAKMHQFEYIYHNWRKKLAQGQQEEVSYLSDILRKFIKKQSALAMQ